MAYIKPRVIYHDKLSQKTTYPYTTKPKNKLGGYCIQEELGVYLFFTLNSSDAALIKKFTVEYNNTDHITQKHPDFSTRYMMSEVGYCDITRFELLTHNVVIGKKADTKNGFVKVGYLSSDKWTEIQTVVKSEDFRSDRRGAKTPQVLADLIKGVNQKETALSLISQLGL